MCAGAANAAVSVLALESRTATNSASLKGAVEHVHTSVDERDAAHDVGFSFWTNNNSSKQDLGQSANTAASSGSLNPSVAEFKASGAPALRLQGSLQGIPASILIDSGAERDCVSQRFLEHHKITFLAPELSELNVALANGQIQSCGLLHTAHLQIQGYSDCSDFAVTELPNEDLILGMPWLLRTDPQIQWRARTLRFAHQGVEHTFSDSPEYKGVPAISAMEFAHDMKKERPAWLCVIKPTLTKNATVGKPVVNCSDLLNTFADVEADPSFPDKRKVEHAIDMLPGTGLQMGSIFRLAPSELEELRKQLDELLAKGLIEPSSSPFGAPVLFVKKKDGSFCMCVDYR